MISPLMSRLYAAFRRADAAAIFRFSMSRGFDFFA